MKKILLVCGSGICTSTPVNARLTKELDDRGWKGQYCVTQGKASDVAAQSENYDLVISTTLLKEECKCPLIIGTQFLLGRGVEAVVDEIVEVLKENG